MVYDNANSEHGPCPQVPLIAIMQSYIDARQDGRHDSTVTCHTFFLAQPTKALLCDDISQSDSCHAPELG